MPRRIVPLVMACDRSPSYLTATLYSMCRSGFGPPMICWDTKKAGPGKAFATVSGIMSTIHRKANDTAFTISLFQDDVWVTQDAYEIATDFYPHAHYAVSLYRMTPLTPEQDLKVKNSGVPCVVPEKTYYDTSIFATETERFDGGCGFMLPGALFERKSTGGNECFESSAIKWNHCPIPLQIGRICSDLDSTHYQRRENAVEHIGSKSSIEERPDWHQMPVNHTYVAAAEKIYELYGDMLECPQMS